MNDQQTESQPQPQPYRHQAAAAGLDPTYKRLLLEADLLQKTAEPFHTYLDGLRQNWFGSAGLARAIHQMRYCLQDMLPIWTPTKHRELNEGFGGGHFEAMDWLRRNDPGNATLAKASSLARRTLLFARQFSEGQPGWNDLVIELLHKCRVRRYFHSSHLRLVHQYRWTVKRAKVAEAEWAVMENGALSGPVTVPEASTPRARKARRER